MPDLGKTRAALRILGDDLDPEEISKLLGAAATESARMGEAKQLPSGRSTYARTGSWRFRAAGCSPGDVNAQVESILSKLTNNLAVWKEISGRYKCDLFCGLFMAEMNEGATLNPNVLSMLGDRGVFLALDIYGPATDT